MNTSDPALPVLADHSRRRESFDVVIVGGGPAGIAAALQTARRGLRTAIIEEHDQLGGQYYKRRGRDLVRRYGDYRPAGTRLLAQAQQAGVERLTNRLVWGIADDGRTLLTSASPQMDDMAVEGRAIILATGAYEAMVPFPGWQRPDVVTAGYALHMATCDVLPIAERVVVAGTGPFLLQVACALQEVGARVEAVIEANTPYRVARRGLSAVRYPARLTEFLRYRTRLAQQRVPILQGWAISSVSDGEDAGLRVDLAPRPGHRQTCVPYRTIAADAVALGYGFRPSTELARLLGCRLRPDPQTGDPIPIVDRDGRSSVDMVYVAGEAAGVAGVHAALIRGELAGTAAAADLGAAGAPLTNARSARRASRRLNGFAEMTSALYPFPRDLAASVPDGTMICRCEGVSAADIRRTTALGWHDRNSIKGATRAGMGPCQGRECALAVGCLLTDDSSSGDMPAYTARFPLKPVPIASLVASPSDQVEAQ